MNEEEITSMIKSLAGSIRGVAEGVTPAVETEAAVDPKNAIREKSVICCECGKSFKVLTKREAPLGYTRLHAGTVQGKVWLQERHFPCGEVLGA